MFRTESEKPKLSISNSALAKNKKKDKKVQACDTEDESYNLALMKILDINMSLFLNDGETKLTRGAKQLHEFISIYKTLSEASKVRLLKNENCKSKLKEISNDFINIQHAPDESSIISFLPDFPAQLSRYLSKKEILLIKDIYNDEIQKYILSNSTWSIDEQCRNALNLKKKKKSVGNKLEKTFSSLQGGAGKLARTIGGGVDKVVSTVVNSKQEDALYDAVPPLSPQSSDTMLEHSSDLYGEKLDEQYKSALKMAESNLESLRVSDAQQSDNQSQGSSTRSSEYMTARTGLSSSSSSSTLSFTTAPDVSALHKRANTDPLAVKLEHKEQTDIRQSLPVAPPFANKPSKLTIIDKQPPAELPPLPPIIAASQASEAGQLKTNISGTPSIAVGKKHDSKSKPIIKEFVGFGQTLVKSVKEQHTKRKLPKSLPNSKEGSSSATAVKSLVKIKPVTADEKNHPQNSPTITLVETQSNNSKAEAGIIEQSSAATIMVNDDAINKENAKAKIYHTLATENDWMALFNLYTTSIYAPCNNLGIEASKVIRKAFFLLDSKEKSFLRILCKLNPAYNKKEDEKFVSSLNNLVLNIFNPNATPQARDQSLREFAEFSVGQQNNDYDNAIKAGIIRYELINRIIISAAVILGAVVTAGIAVTIVLATGGLIVIPVILSLASGIAVGMLTFAIGSIVPNEPMPLSATSEACISDLKESAEHMIRGV